MKALLATVSALVFLVGCAGQSAAPQEMGNGPTDTPAATAPTTFVEGTYQVTYKLDPNAWQTCVTDTSSAGLSDEWDVHNGTVTSSVAGTFTFSSSDDSIHGVSSHASEGEDANQRVVKDVFASFDASGFSGLMILSVLDGAKDSSPQCSNTYLITGTRR